MGWMISPLLYLLVVVYYAHHCWADCGFPGEYFTGSTPTGSNSRKRFAEQETVSSNCYLEYYIQVRTCQKGQWVFDESRVGSFYYRSCIKDKSKEISISRIQVLDLESNETLVDLSSGTFKVGDLSKNIIVKKNEQPKLKAKKCVTSRSRKSQKWIITLSEAIPFSLVEMEFSQNNINNISTHMSIPPQTWGKNSTQKCYFADHMNANFIPNEDVLKKMLIVFPLLEEIERNSMTLIYYCESERFDFKHKTSVKDAKIYDEDSVELVEDEEGEEYEEGEKDEKHPFTVFLSKQFEVSLEEDNYTEDVAFCGLKISEFPLFNCGSPEVPLNGEVTTINIPINVIRQGQEDKPLTVNSTRAVYSCEKGYVLHDENETREAIRDKSGLSCSAEARWIGTIPFCRPVIGCPLFATSGKDSAEPDIEYEKYTYLNGKVYAMNGTLAKFSCGNASRSNNITMKPDSHFTSKCTEEGKWDEEKPKCEVDHQHKGSHIAKGKDGQNNAAISQVMTVGSVILLLIVVLLLCLGATVAYRKVNENNDEFKVSADAGEGPALKNTRNTLIDPDVVVETTSVAPLKRESKVTYAVAKKDGMQNLVVGEDEEEDKYVDMNGSNYDIRVESQEKEDKRSESPPEIHLRTSFEEAIDEANGQNNGENHTEV